MSVKVRVLQLVIVPLFFGSLIGCNSFTQLGNALSNQGNLPQTNVAQLPQQEQQTTIYLKGTVSSQAPFVGGGAYQLKDETGTIWVITQGKMPNIGQEVAIEGKLAYQSIPIGSQDMGELYVLEVQPVEAKRLVQQTPSSTTETPTPNISTATPSQVVTSNTPPNTQPTEVESVARVNPAPATTAKTPLAKPNQIETVTNNSQNQTNPVKPTATATATKPQPVTNNNQTSTVKPTSVAVSTPNETVKPSVVTPEKPAVSETVTIKPKPMLNIPFLPHKENQK